jgi:hypothetical protein
MVFERNMGLAFTAPWNYKKGYMFTISIGE